MTTPKDAPYKQEQRKLRNKAKDKPLSRDWYRVNFGFGGKVKPKVKSFNQQRKQRIKGNRIGTVFFGAKKRLVDNLQPKQEKK